jgi:hypothetical protein
MKNYLRLLPILLICFIFSRETTAQQNVLTHKEKADGWVLLFDGKTTNGWRGFKMDGIPKDWSVVDGCLVCSGSGGGEMSGDLITVNQYSDFDLYLEWAISPAGNSGILFHILEGDYQSTYATGPEYQLIDDVGYPDKLEEWQQTGANYAMNTADKTNKKLMPVGEFNSSEIKVENGHVTHWLNGKKIVEYTLWTDDWYKQVSESKWKDYPGYGLAKKGHIGLQDHGSFVKFRNIKLKKLE